MTTPLRASLWLRGTWLGDEDDDTRLWLRLDDGRIAAWRLPAARFGDESLAAVLARQTAVSEASPAAAADIVPLPIAPAAILPLLSWGDPRHAAARAFAAALDQEILRRLAGLGGAGHFDSVVNYNRLAHLDPEQRQRWFQALERFPPLTAPLLLTAHPRLDTAVAGPVRRDEDAAVIAAVERGRDLTGALARHYGLSRSLVRAPLCRQSWPDLGLDRHLLLHLIDGIPAHRRPTTWEEVKRNRGLLGRLLSLADSPDDARHLGATAFRAGLDATRKALETRFAPLGPALDDSLDFCRAAVAGTALRSPRRLALAWVQRRGIASLLAASRRWHRFARQRERTESDPGRRLPGIYGEGEYEGVAFRELSCLDDFVREGQEMRHCVASYWEICLRGRSRIFALARAGERGTAEYAFDPEPAETAGHFRLRQLRGPENTEVSAALTRAATAFETVLNAPERIEVRRRIAADHHRFRSGFDATDQSLDPQSRRERETVLTHAEATGLTAGRREWLRAWVAGYQYHQGEWVEPYLNAGTRLDLAREPDNPHDPLAVRIDWQGVKLGYVPRDDNAAIAAHLDAGGRLTCRVLFFNPAAPPWQRLRFVVEGTPAP